MTPVCDSSFITKETHLDAKPDKDILDMDEALCSILSGEYEWIYHEEGISIKFNKDGTGEVCRSLAISPDGH